MLREAPLDVTHDPRLVDLFAGLIRVVSIAFGGLRLAHVSFVRDNKQGTRTSAET